MNIVICITYEICEINENSNYKVCTRWTPLREEANEVIGAGTAIYVNEYNVAHMKISNTQI